MMEAYDKLEKCTEKERDNLTKEQAKLTRDVSNASAAKGKQGEQEFAALITSHTNWVHTPIKGGHCTDLFRLELVRHALK